MHTRARSVPGHPFHAGSVSTILIGGKERENFQHRKRMPRSRDQHHVPAYLTACPWSGAKRKGEKGRKKKKGAERERGSAQRICAASSAPRGDPRLRDAFRKASSRTQGKEERKGKSHFGIGGGISRRQGLEIFPRSRWVAIRCGRRRGNLRKRTKEREKRKKCGDKRGKGNSTGKRRYLSSAGLDL